MGAGGRGKGTLVPEAPGSSPSAGEGRRGAAKRLRAAAPQRPDPLPTLEALGLSREENNKALKDLPKVDGKMVCLDCNC